MESKYEQGVVVWSSPDSEDLTCHQQCPLTDLLKCLPNFGELVELYFRCKLCPVNQVHQGKESLLTHIRRCHATYYQHPAPKQIVTIDTYPTTDGQNIQQVQQVKNEKVPHEYGQVIEVDFGAAVSQTATLTGGAHQDGNSTTMSLSAVEASEADIHDVHVLTEAHLGPESVVLQETVVCTDHQTVHSAQHSYASSHQEEFDSCGENDGMLEFVIETPVTEPSSKRARVQPLFPSKTLAQKLMQPQGMAGASSRLHESLVKCVNVDCSMYPTLSHFHCKPCGALVKEFDVGVHKYAHACIRPINDMNFVEVVQKGSFCDELACLHDTGYIGPKGSLHVHCHYCESIMEPGQPFHSHLKKLHPPGHDECIKFGGLETEPLQCMYCRAYFNDEQLLHQHTTLSHFARMGNRTKGSKDAGKYVIMCPLCTNCKFKQSDQLRIHLATTHKVCDPSLLKQHVMKVQCLLCEEKIVGKSKLSKHMWRFHSNSSTHPCEFCQGVYGSEEALEEHNREKHALVESP